MSAPILYSGPGKVIQTYASHPYDYQADGENGQIKLAIAGKRTKRSTAMLGYIRSTLDDETVHLSLTPFDSWKILPALFPGYLGIDTSAIANGAAAALVIGTRPHDIAAGTVNTGATTTVWTPDGRLYTIFRTAITKHPVLKLGVGMPLYGDMEITGLVDAASPIGTASKLITSIQGPNDTGAAAAADPDVGNYALDFVNGYWTGSWNSITGIDAEDGWELMVDAKYSPLTVQKRTYHYKLDSVEVSVKARLSGPAHSVLMTNTLNNTAQVAGATIQNAVNTPAPLVLTGPAGLTGSAKTITVTDCQVFFEGGGFEFGGTKLGTGEVVFVSKVDITSGLPTSVLTFSA